MNKKLIYFWNLFLFLLCIFSESVKAGPNLKDIQNQETIRNNKPPCFEFKNQKQYSYSPITPFNAYKPQGKVLWPSKTIEGRITIGKSVYVFSPSRKNWSYNNVCEKEYEGKLGKTVTLNRCNFLSESSDYESQVSWEVKKGNYRGIEGEYLISLQRNRDCGQQEWDSVRERIYPIKSLLRDKAIWID